MKYSQNSIVHITWTSDLAYYEDDVNKNDIIEIYCICIEIVSFFSVYAHWELTFNILLF